ncbi:hypothetical protein DQ238_10290 [Geodermatophilus sp. TF02-6]|uniref:LuxR C-terminal-related transcriptional regulator n=1 Tax=Geodermatophilus sp. TF02-6 TaxID=2250575 RepID=UPI000E029390|nr:LuxR C-terminal-related transcriptional regulator [Geodermatophilus sp. TF02-6]RBY79575.1 hypothetical protein DQ238_10290 [Geodermatophilus sp. TF02-6]
MIGRDEDVDHLSELLVREGTQLVTLTGMGGVGKTSVAAAVATRLAARIPVVPWSVGKASRGAPAPVRSRPLTSAAGDHSMAAAAAEQAQLVLWVLDDAEQLLDLRGLLQRARTASPRVRVLATSATPLGVEGEIVYRVRPLPWATAGSTPPGPGPRLRPPAAATPPAVALYAARAAEADATFQLTSMNTAAVTGLCRLLSGHPLALELAAARVASLPPEAFVDALRNGAGLELLRAPRPRHTSPGPARHTSMAAALDATVRHVPPAAQSLLGDLAVFAGPFTLDDAAAVTGSTDSTGVGDLFDTLAELVDVELVDPGTEQDPAVPGLYHLPTLVRMYARGHLDGTDSAQVADRHLRHVTALAAKAGAAHLAGDLTLAYRLLDTYWADILAAVDRHRSSGEVLAALRCAVDCAPYLVAVGHDAAARLRIEQLLEATHPLDGVDPNLVARGLLWSAALTRHTTNPQAHSRWARQRLADGLQLARDCAEETVLLLGLELAFTTYPVTGDRKTATAAVAEARHRCERRGDQRRLARFEAYAAMLTHQAGDPDAAFDLGRAALDRAQAHDDARATILAALALLGLPHPPPAALPDIAHLLSLCRTVNDQYARSYLLAVSAGRLLLDHDYSGAATAAVEHLQLVDQFRAADTIQPALTHVTLVTLAAETGDLEAAATLQGRLEHLTPVLHSVLVPARRARYDDALRTVRRRLGPHRYTTLGREGARLSAEAALCLALDYATTVAVRVDPDRTDGAAQPHSVLTARQIDILCAVAAGLSDSEIASELGLSVRTVSNHCAAIYRKIGVRSRVEATNWTHQHGLMS